MNIIEEVKKLSLPYGQYVVFGSGILSVKNIRPAKDIDLLVTEELFNRLKKNGWKRKILFSHTLTCRLVVNGHLEAFFHTKRCPHPHTTKNIIDTAEIIDGVSFMNLQELKRFKLTLARPKDLDDVKLIDEYLQKNP